MRINGSSFVISRNPPDCDTESGNESEHRTGVRVANKPEEAFPPDLALRYSDRFVDVEIGSSSVTS
jgi:hypothetical protein